MPAENTPSPVSPPNIRVSIRNDSPQAEADYPFYQVISDNTHSFRIELIEDPDRKKPPYHNIDFSIGTRLVENAETEEDSLLVFTRFNDDGDELPPGTHLLKWTTPLEGLLFSDGRNLSVQTSTGKGIIVGDETGCGWIPLPAGNASFGWKGDIGWSWFKAAENAILAVLTIPPADGFGPAICRKLTINADGTWAAVGPEIPVIVPKM
jgi:hypothetical protein